MVLNLNMKYLQKALVSKLLAKKADMVWLASDEDQEKLFGILEELKLDKTKQNELYFMKTTKPLF
jgi:DNA topoisomerase-1